MTNLKEEKKLWKKRYKIIVGLDEAGRGALAGPVVAAAVMVNSKIKNQKSKLQFKIQNLKDSKKLSAKKREEIYKILMTSPNIEWAIGKVSEKVIDKINILEATKLAMKRAIQNLEKKLKKKPKYLKGTIVRFNHRVDFLILDGNFKIDLPIPQKSIIKADEKVLSCALSSIVAKVYRDKIMERYAKKYPQYGFERHKGYLTKFHQKMLKKYSLSKIHRKSFKPIQKLLKKNDYFANI